MSTFTTRRGTITYDLWSEDFGCAFRFRIAYRLDYEPRTLATPEDTEIDFGEKFEEFIGFLRDGELVEQSRESREIESSRWVKYWFLRLLHQRPGMREDIEAVILAQEGL